MIRFSTIVVFAVLTAGGIVGAAEIEFFESRIRPVLVEHCYACHNSTDAAEGDLTLDFRDGLRRGGSGGALIQPGDPGRSRLVAILKHQIEGLEMPEDGPKLDDSVIADFEKWIADGAVDPRDEPPSADQIGAATSWEATLQRRKQWWSFQPIREPQLLPGEGHPIDRWIRASLKTEGLSPAPPAEPEVLIRRLFFNLIGLPPTPGQLEYWLNRYRRDDVADLAKSSDASVVRARVLSG